MGTRILVRHAQSRYNAGETEDFDSDVTERGKYQIDEVSLHVKQVLGDCKNFTGFVSPYLRTLKTAFALWHRLDVPFVVEPRIGELPSDHKSLKVALIPSRHGQFFTYNWSRFPKEGQEVQDRTLKQYREELEVFARELPEDAIVVSHLSTSRDLAEILTGIDLKGREVPNASVTLIEEGQLIFLGQR